MINEKELHHRLWLACFPIYFLGSYASAALQLHNKLRGIHGAKPLKMNSELASAAQQHAKQSASSGKMDVSGTDDGENLAMKCSSKGEMTVQEAIMHW